MKKSMKLIGIIAFIGATGLLYSCTKDNSSEFLISTTSQPDYSTPPSLNPENSHSPNVAVKQKVIVHICGQVKNPGVYQLEGTGRVFDVIAKAGGFTKEAAADYVNQARIVTDGEQIYIPTKDEVKNEDLVETVSGDEKQGQSSFVNLNKATKEQLMTLPGIGEAKADMIIQYREKNGSFQKAEDIMKIEGIKEGVFQKIKDLITVD